MAPHTYKVVKTHAIEINGWKTLSRVIYACVPTIGGMNGDVKYDLATLAFKNG